MNRGRFTLVALVAAIFALALSACGNDEPERPEDPFAGRTSTLSPSVTGETAEAARAREKKEGPPDATGVPKALSDPSHNKQDTRKDKPAPGAEAAVTAAAERLEKAIEAQDVKFLCDKAYAQEYLDTLAEAGGCKKKIALQIANIERYDIKVKGMNFVAADDVEVAATLSFTRDGKKKTTQPHINFKREDGAWKYYIRVVEG